MTSAAVEWQLRLIDKATGPARRMLEMADRLERRITSTDRRIERMDRSLERAGRGGAASARQIDQGYAKVESRLARVTRIAGTAGKALLGLGAVAGASALKAAIVDAAAYKQDQLTSLAGMMKGDKQRAAALFGKAAAFAAATPFTTREILDATRQAIAIGFDDKNAIPLVELAGKLSAGSGKSMDMAMEAFAALRGGDFGQAFGVGQGFSNLNISRQMLRKAGLKFDAQGGYQGSIQEGVNAVAKIINETYGGAMGERSRNLSGLASTLVSRPQELFMGLVDDMGNSKALKPLQDFMANLADLSDFSKNPGKRIQERFEKSMGSLMSAIFNPLASATSGDKGIAAVEKALDKLDAFAKWTEANGPTIRAFFSGLTSGLGAVWRVIQAMATPFEWLFKKLGLIGENDSSGLAKTVGYLLAAGLAVRLLGGAFLLLAGPAPLIFTLFSALATLSTAVPMLVRAGVLTAGTAGRIMAVLTPLRRTAQVFAILMGGWRGSLLGLLTTGQRLLRGFLVPFVAGWGRFVRLLGAGRGLVAAGQGAAQFASRFGWIARVMPIVARLLPLFGRLAGLLGGPVGWVLSLVGLGAELYTRWEPFRKLVDGIWDSIKGWGSAAPDFGKNLWDKLASGWSALPASVREFLEGTTFGQALSMLVDASAQPASASPGVVASPMGGSIQTNAPQLFVPGVSLGVGAGGMAPGTTFAPAAPVTITNHFNVAGSMDGQAVADIGDKFSTFALEGGVGS